jgi:hypothetical protein
MPTTYEPIATTTLSTATASVTFSSISSTYTDLRLVIFALGATSDYPYVEINSDTGTNYSKTVVYGNGSSALSFRSSNNAKPDFVDATKTSGGFMDIYVDFMNYSNTTTYKTWLAREGNGTNGYVSALVGLWRNTNAITQIKVLNTGSGNFATGSTFTLYGIKSA